MLLVQRKGTWLGGTVSVELTFESSLWILSRTVFVCPLTAIVGWLVPSHRGKKILLQFRWRWSTAYFVTLRMVSTLRYRAINGINITPKTRLLGLFFSAVYVCIAQNPAVLHWSGKWWQFCFWLSNFSETIWLMFLSDLLGTGFSFVWAWPFTLYVTCSFVRLWIVSPVSWPWMRIVLLLSSRIVLRGYTQPFHQRTWP